MYKKIHAAAFLACLLFLVLVSLQVAFCQTSSPTLSPTPTGHGKTSSISLPLIGGIIAAVVVVVVVALFVLKKRGNGRSPGGIGFEAQVIKKFNGTLGDPSLGVSGFTEGGQPLLIKEAPPVSLAEVDAFIQVLVKGKAQKGIVVAANFEDNALEGKLAAMDNGIELQLLRINEVMNKRYANRIKELASAQVTFEAPPPPAYVGNGQVTRAAAFDERMPKELQQEPLKPRVFISCSKTQVADQVMEMLGFLHYDYVMGDKEETTVPIPENKFGVMRDCDCAIINIAAAEQERRYSGLYVLNSTVISEINAAYLKYNTQVVLLVERKVELPTNLKGLRRIDYDSDDLSFNAAMYLKKMLEEFKKL